jgi:xylose isomerase
MIQPYPFSIGGWCLVSGGSDPFGGPTRSLPLETGLDGCAEAGIHYVSFHDRDLWDDDAPPKTIEKTMAEVVKKVTSRGLKIFNFTTNLFSNSCFRSGALSSPFPEVRAAAIVKACRSMDVAAQFGARSMIFWGGREGSDGSYEQDPGLGLRRYMEGIKVCVDYALEKGYTYTVTIETKVYEPRLLMLFAGTGASAASAIRHYFPDPKYRGRVLVNPEYPQHVAMLNLDPAFELGQLMEEGMLAPFIHFGGQIPGRMDCDLPPGLGGSLLADFEVCYLLHSRGWQGVVEFDCRPIRTTATAAGMKLFLKHCTGYWQMLEGKVDLYQRDPIMARIRSELDRPEAKELAAVMAALRNGRGVVEAVSGLTRSFGSFEATAGVDTDVIEAHVYRLLQLLTGTHETGAALFAGTPWGA